MKKLLLGICLVSLACLPAFADFRKEFRWNMEDPATIDRCLAEAQAANHKHYINLWTEQKNLIGKNSKNTSYEELKKMYNGRGFAQRVMQDDRFNKDYLKIALNDQTLSNSCKRYIRKFYASYKSVHILNKDEYRNAFINLSYLMNIDRADIAKNILKAYMGNVSLKLSNEEVKRDISTFKRAWYPNISKSDDWKAIMVEIELISKSLQ